MTLNPSSLLCFGEVLWDVFPFGEHIGGAPFNIAAHASHCGLRSLFYSRVGHDSRGHRAQSELKLHGIDDRFLQIDIARETGWVDIELQDGQPSYRITPNVAWDAIEGPKGATLIHLLGDRFAALACGTLAQRSECSRAALAEIRRNLPGVPVFYDVNLRGAETPIEIVRATLPGVRWLKVNEDEARLLSQTLFGAELYGIELASAFSSEFGVKTLLVTRGAKGCEIVAEGELVTVAASPVKAASTVGAGDAFSAAFLSGILQGLPVVKSARRASKLAEWVVSQCEAVPHYPLELKELFRSNAEPSEFYSMPFAQ